MTLVDVTSGQRFTVTRRTGLVDVTSAKWIRERFLVPLSDFRRLVVSAAGAMDATGHGSPLQSARWQLTRLWMPGGAVGWPSRDGGFVIGRTAVRL
jgi:hypothetical protein